MRSLESCVRNRRVPYVSKLSYSILSLLSMTSACTPLNVQISTGHVDISIVNCLRGAPYTKECVKNKIESMLDKYGDVEALLEGNSFQCEPKKVAVFICRLEYSDKAYGIFDTNYNINKYYIMALVDRNMITNVVISTESTDSNGKYYPPREIKK
jgi:hypothetical protein